MNEYIILNKLTYEASGKIVPARYLVPLKTLVYWEPYYQGGTYVYLEGDFHKGTLHVKETSSEIEALIMGEEHIKLKSLLKDAQEDLEKLKIHSGWDIDWAIEKATKLLKEENANLKEKLHKLKCVEEENEKLQRDILLLKNADISALDIGCEACGELNQGMALLSIENFKLKEELTKLKEQLSRSNPDNPCCRETFSKLNDYYNGANINYFCNSQEELDERGKLEAWRESFKNKMKENKND